MEEGEKPAPLPPGSRGEEGSGMVRTQRQRHANDLRRSRHATWLGQHRSGIEEKSLITSYKKTSAWGS